MLLSPDAAVDAVLDRAVRAAQEPFRLRRAMTRLRGPSHSLYCSISDPPLYGNVYCWRSGLAMLEPGCFRFVQPHSRQRSLTFEVHSVIETRETGQGRDNGPGPRQRGVVKLETAGGYVFWSAHPKLLADGTAIILARPRSID